MKRSTDRILTTHTGSLLRPPDLLEQLLQKEEGQQVDDAAFPEQVSVAVRETMLKQVEAGVGGVMVGAASERRLCRKPRTRTATGKPLHLRQ